MTKTKLLHAEKITIELFEAVKDNKLFISGKSEAQLSAEVCDVALNKFGLVNHWH